MEVLKKNALGHVWVVGIVKKKHMWSAERSENVITSKNVYTYRLLAVFHSVQIIIFFKGLFPLPPSTTYFFNSWRCLLNKTTIVYKCYCLRLISCMKTIYS